MHKDTKLSLLLAFYVGALYAANLLGGKLMPIGFGSRGLTVSIIMMPFLFLITDIVGEVYGRKKAKEFVTVGLASMFVLLAWQLFCVLVPSAVPNAWYETFNPAYQMVFGMTITFTIASIAAFVGGQYVDVFTYHAIRKRWGKRRLWLRNNVSTIIGQFVDTNLYIFIAFFPRLLDSSFTVPELFGAVIIPYWLAKVVMAFFDTPLCYLGVWWLAGKKKAKARWRSSSTSH